MDVAPAPTTIIRFDRSGRPVPDLPAEALVQQISAQQEELRTQNAQLSESQELLQQILSEYTDLYDHAPVAYVTLDVNGLISRMNETAAALLGVRRDRLTGLPFHAFVGEAGLADYREHLRRCRTRQPYVSTELALTRSDGRRVPVELISRPAVGSGGFFTAVLDLTERKRAETRAADLTAELERRTSEAEQYAARLRALAAKLTEAENAERRRLARNLHDHLQQELIAAKYRVAIARGNPSGDAAMLDEIEASLARCFDASRQITADLTPPPLQQGAGLPAALRWLADRTRERHGLAVAVSTPPDGDPAAEPVRVLLYEAARELLLNIVKHAGVPEAAVSLTRVEPRRLRMAVTDEGRGFDLSELLDRADAVTGLGLFGLRERVENLGGALEVRSGPGVGTAVVLEVPDAPVQSANGRAAEPKKNTDPIPR